MVWELTKSARRYVAVGLVVSVFAWLAYWSLAPEPEQPSNQAVLDPVLAPFQPKIEVLKALALVNTAHAAEQAEGLLEELPAAYRNHYAFGFNAGIQEIEFHGRVVDQYGQPLEGVHVPYSGNGKFLASGGGSGNAYTDAEGRFTIKTRGGSFTLVAFQHPLIDFVFPPERSSDGKLLRDASLQRNFYSHQPEKGGTEPLWTACTAEQPCVFQAWRVERYESVKSGSSAGKYPDGRVYTLDFLKDMRHQKTEGLNGGHIRVRCIRSPMGGYRDTGDWSVTLSAVEGGIQSTDDYYLNLAPESGYQPEVTINMTKGAPGYRDKLLNQRYYFTTGSGRVYGSLRASFEPFSNLEGCVVFVDHFKFNPNGSRSLALRPRE